MDISWITSKISLAVIETPRHSTDFLFLAEGIIGTLKF